MIQMQSVTEVADNTGAKKVMCIKVRGGSHRHYAGIGDVINVTVKEAMPKGKVKKGEVMLALIIRTRKELRRLDGSTLTFGSNAVILLNKQMQPIGTRVFGPVPRELRENWMKIISLAEEVV